MALAARHGPASNRYSYPVTAEPPSDAGAANATCRKLLPGATVRSVGAPGVSRGVADASADQEPGPAVFTAAKEGGMKNYFIEQEQGGGWDAMVKGIAYLKTLSV